MLLGLKLAGVGLLVLIAAVALARLAYGAEDSGAPGPSAGGYRLVEVENPRYRSNELFTSQEDITSPRFVEVRERYPLAELVAGEEEEFRSILLLRHWVHERLVVDRSKPVPEGDALVYLAEGPKGAAYSCGHHEVTLNATLNAMGYVTRCVFAGAGAPEGRLSGAHGMCEVWSNQWVKWVIVDSEHDSHFEKEGVPLSALEIRDEVIRNGGADVVRVDGPDRAAQPREQDDSYGRTPTTYTFVSWRLQGDVHSALHPRSSVELVYDDDYWRNNTWGRGGQPHWAYKAGYFLPIKNRAWIEWTPNVLRVRTTIDASTAHVRIDSYTPNFKEYQIKAEGGDWQPTEGSFSLPLTKERHDWRLRSVNVMDVPGPEHQLVIEQQ